ARAIQNRGLARHAIELERFPTEHESPSKGIGRLLSEFGSSSFLLERLRSEVDALRFSLRRSVRNVGGPAERTQPLRTITVCPRCCVRRPKLCGESAKFRAPCVE